MKKSLLLIVLTQVLCGLIMTTSTLLAQTEIYRQAFSASTDFDTMTVLDVNEDGITWAYDTNSRCAKISFNNDSEQNDWLITPALSMKEKCLYEISFAVTGGGAWAHDSYSASIGSTPTAEGLTTELWPRTTLQDSENKAVKKMKFYAEQAGDYYFGIHCSSDIGQSTLRMDDIVVTEVSGSTPAAPQLSIQVQSKGGLSAKLTAVAPTKNVDGSDVESLTKLSFYRDNVLLKSVDNPVPGESYSAPDALPYARMNEYKCVATNEIGDGEPAIVNQWVGLDTPAAVGNLRYTEDPTTPGVLILSWDAPTTGEHGGYFDDGTVQYYISAGSEADSCVGGQPTCTYDLKTYSQQKSVTIGVWASNSAGANRSLWKLITCVAGPSVVAPLTESFSKVVGPWTSEITRGTLGEVHWYNQTEPLFGGSQDGDGYCEVLGSDFEDRACRLKSPKIDIRALTQPKLAFFTYLTGRADTLKIQVNPEFSGWQTLKTMTMEGGSGWTRYEIDLSDYSTYEFLQVGFEGVALTTGRSCIGIDQVSLRSDLDYDMEALSISAPDKVVVDEKTEFVITVRNNGKQTVNRKDCQLLLLKNGNTVDSTWDFSVSPGTMQTVTLTDTPTFADGRAVVYQALISYTKDEYTENDMSGRVSVAVQQPQYPAPNTLVADQLESGKVALVWSFDSSDGVFAPATTDGFEDYQAFSISNLGNWAQYDGDGQATIKMAIAIGDQVSVLDYENAGAAMAFQVMNPEQAGIPYTSWDSHGGDQYVAAFRNSTNTQDQTIHQNDDWLISPLLCAKKQTISFFAKATMNTSVPETVEVLWSNSVYIRSEEDLESFEKIGEFQISNISGWKEYTFEVPTLSAHFALRYRSQGKYAVLIDDVSYVPYDAEEPTVVFEGYNIFRNDEQIGFTNQPRWVDDDAVSGESYKYNVTAVYSIDDKYAESTYSNDAFVGTDAVDALSLQKSIIDTETYNVAGQRVKRDYKGLIISNGHKSFLR